MLSKYIFSDWKYLSILNIKNEEEEYDDDEEQRNFGAYFMNSIEFPLIKLTDGDAMHGKIYIANEILCASYSAFFFSFDFILFYFINTKSGSSGKRMMMAEYSA